MAPPRGHIFYIGLYRENMKQSSCLKPKGIESWYLVFGPLQSLFKLYPGAKNGPSPGGHMFNIGLYGENMEKIFFS